jgi:chemotaxis protein histidine kinase CheA
MSDETGLEDDMMADLFRSEVETHSESLSAALLALERSPSDTSRIDEMMRAAHSIKGASRVVGVDPAVSVAHVMEDCFVAAQTGALSFSPGDIDVLLRGVDLLGKISAATRDPKVDLAHDFSGPVQALVAELQGVLTGSGKSEKASATVPAELEPVAAGQGSTSASPVTIVFPEILDATAAERIRGELLAATDSRSHAIRFALQATKDLDVTGLALLAAVPSHLAKHGSPALELTGVSPEMETVFRVTGLAAKFGAGRDLARETR